MRIIGCRRRSGRPCWWWRIRKSAKTTITAARAICRDESLGPLPDAEEEARQIRVLYRGNATVVTGAEATEAFVKRNAARYRIVHLATHASFDANTPLYSHLLARCVRPAWP